MTYRPRFRKQGDGSRCQWVNCGPASQAMAADRHRRGRDPANRFGWPPTPVEIRNRISPTTCGNTTLTQLDAASTTMYEANMLVRYGVPWDTFRSAIVAGKGAIVQISYAVIAPTRYDASPGFTGRHAIFVNERRTADGAYLVYDPLADGRRAGIPRAPQWWPGSLLRRAAEAFPGTATGHINASFTRDTEP